MSPRKHKIILIEVHQELWQEHSVGRKKYKRPCKLRFQGSIVFNNQTVTVANKKPAWFLPIVYAMILLSITPEGCCIVCISTYNLSKLFYQWT